MLRRSAKANDVAAKAAVWKLRIMLAILVILAAGCGDSGTKNVPPSGDKAAPKPEQVSEHRTDHFPPMLIEAFSSHLEIEHELVPSGNNDMVATVHSDDQYGRITLVQIFRLSGKPRYEDYLTPKGVDRSLKLTVREPLEQDYDVVFTGDYGQPGAKTLFVKGGKDFVKTADQDPPSVRAKRYGIGKGQSGGKTKVIKLELIDSDGGQTNIGNLSGRTFYIVVHFAHPVKLPQ